MKKNEKKQFCINGHNTFITGRDSCSHCIVCKNLYQQKFRELRKEEVFQKSKTYRVSHRAKLVNNTKNWRKNNRAQVAQSNLKNKTNRSLRIVAWTDWDNIIGFYNNCHIGMVVDHIIPLQGKKVSGLHVSWNLQYLTKYENDTKYNTFDGTIENNGWKGA